MSYEYNFEENCAYIKKKDWEKLERELFHEVYNEDDLSRSVGVEVFENKINTFAKIKLKNFCLPFTTMNGSFDRIGELTKPLQGGNPFSLPFIYHSILKEAGIKYETKEDINKIFLESFENLKLNRFPNQGYWSAGFTLDLPYDSQEVLIDSLSIANRYRKDMNKLFGINSIGFTIGNYFGKFDTLGDTIRNLLIPEWEDDGPNYSNKFTFEYQNAIEDIENLFIEERKYIANEYEKIGPQLLDIFKSLNDELRIEPAKTQ